MGMSTKKIAAELGVSPNTVRTQLSHLYSKLDVHDKAQLAQRLMSV
ncbi:MAG: response regulator transcription factor [Burkholderiaceae bacterium]